MSDHLTPDAKEQMYRARGSTSRKDFAEMYGISVREVARIQRSYTPSMAKKKRGYSDEFPTTREKRVYFMLDKIPPALWIRVKAKAKREGVSLRALILGWCKEWVEK